MSRELTCTHQGSRRRRRERLRAVLFDSEGAATLTVQSTKAADSTRWRAKTQHCANRYELSRLEDLDQAPSLPSTHRHLIICTDAYIYTMDQGSSKLLPSTTNNYVCVLLALRMQLSKANNLSNSVQRINCKIPLRSKHFVHTMLIFKPFGFVA